MYNETLIERELSKEQQIMCLSTMKSQVSKLDWLVKALIKMSRLENNIISLNKSFAYIKDTIATVLSGVYLKAEEKDISIKVECSDDITIKPSQPSLPFLISPSPLHLDFASPAVI